MNNKLIIIFIFLILSIPLLNYLAFEDISGDPFVAHVIVPAYVLDKTNSISGVTEYISSTNENLEKDTWVWQDSTTSLLEGGVIGSTIVLFALGSITGIDFQVLGSLPIPYLFYSLLFFILVIWIIKCLTSQNKEITKGTAIIVGVIIATVFLDFYFNVAFHKLLGFQYHAIAWIAYLAIVYLFFNGLSTHFDWKKISLIIILFGPLVLTHYRFPALIIFDFTSLALIFLFLGLFTNNILLKNKAKRIAKLSVILTIIASYSGYYWYLLGSRGSSFFDFNFLFTYIGSVITFEKLGDAAEFSQTFQDVYALPWKYVFYIQAALFLTLTLVLSLIILLRVKHKEVSTLDFIFFWGLGSTIFMNLSYFMNYKGYTGLGLYEVYLFLLFSLVLWVPLRNQRFKLRKIAKYVSFALAVITIVNVAFGVNSSLRFDSFSKQATNDAESAYPFLMQYISGSGEIFASSFPVSAAMYQFFAKSDLQIIAKTGFRPIASEVITFRSNGNFSMLSDSLTKLNDFLFITKYEAMHGLSTDVIGYSSSISSNETQVLQNKFISDKSLIYNSGEALIFSFD